MKTFFLFVQEPDKWEPRKRLGLTDATSTAQRELLDAIDLLEQKADFAIQVALRAHYLAIILLAITILTNGPAALKIVQGWLGTPPAALGEIASGESGK